MDKELIAYFDRRFGDLERSLDRGFGENEEAARRAMAEFGKEQPEGLDYRIGGLDDEAPDRRVGDLEGSSEALCRTIERGFREMWRTLEEIRRLMDICQEGVAEMNAKLDRRHEDSQRAQRETRELYAAYGLTPPEGDTGIEEAEAR